MSTIFQNFVRRFGFGNSVCRPADRKPQVRLCLEALDERILPSTSPFTPVAFVPINAKYEDLRMVPQYQIPLIPFLNDTTPNLTGPMQKGSTIDLGVGTLTINSEQVNSQTGVMQFSGTFESKATISLFGFINLSDDIGAIPVTGQISTLPTSAGTGNFNGSNLRYYTNSISFQGTGDGGLIDSESGIMLNDHQQVSFSGSVLSVFSPNGPVAASVSGSTDVKDTVTVPGVSLPQVFDTGSVATSGISWLGTEWAPIQYTS